jgi:hypothetical protein
LVFVSKINWILLDEPHVAHSNGVSRSVLVLGSQGVLGSLVADAFDRAGWTTVRAGRRAGPAAGVHRVDLTSPETLERVLDDVKPDLVVSSVPDASLTAERAVLRRGGLILNFSTLAISEIRRLRAEPASDGDGTVVFYAGIAPGLSNLIVAGLLARHPEADEIEMAFTISANSSSGPAAADGGWDELTAARRHPTVVIPLPSPFGRTRCLGYGGPDFTGWLGPTAEGRTVSPYICLTPRPVRYALLAANAAGLITRLPRKVASAKPPAASSAASSEPVAHWIAVRRNGTLLAARTIRCQGDYGSSAVITVLFAHALADGAVASHAGALFPDEAISLDELRPGLASAGITISDEQIAH